MSINGIKQFSKLSLSLAKGRSRDTVVIAIIALVGAGAFALGHLSALESGEVIFEQRAATQDAFRENAPFETGDIPLSSQAANAGTVIASKSGAKYHFPWCAGARGIKEENKIWFDSVEAARTAGYTPASNCKGLK